MRTRFLARWCPGNETHVDFPTGQSDLDPSVDTDCLQIASDPSLPVFKASDSGFVIGALFGRGQDHPARSIDGEVRAAVMRSSGSVLVERFWGAWLALLPRPDGDAIDVIRGPLGHLSCYACWRDGCWWLASDAALLAMATGTSFACDRDAVARHLGQPELAGTETCLAGVIDLRGGDRNRLFRNGEHRIDSLWSPWTFTDRAARNGDEEACVRRVREATMLSVRSHAALYSRIVLLLSGGLDSSIVASCLASSGTPTSALTFVTDDRIGDERAFARIAAAAAKIDLAERDRDPAGIDFATSLAATLPRPFARAFNQESDRLAIVEARRVNATAIFSGGGGDNIYCSHRSVAATADSLLTGGFGAAFMTTARALGSLTQAALPRVVWETIKRAYCRPASPRRMRDVSFLSHRAAAIAWTRDDHPWLVAPRGTLPGRAIHVSLLAVAQAQIESAGIARAIADVSPLVSQPMAEACLQVPSHFWFAIGQDRAAARRAFAGSLPPSIIARRSKGSPAPFAAAVLERRREALKPFMLDGALASMGLIDTDAVRAFLDDPAPQRGYTFTRLLTLIDTEAWARNWT